MLHPVSIDPEAVYDDGAIRQALGLTDSALTAARRARTLRFSRHGKRILYRGSWLLEWLEAAAATPQDARHAARPEEAAHA